MHLKKNLIDSAFYLICGVASLAVLALIVGILLILFSESSLSLEKFGIWRFLTSTDWNPVRESFGATTSLFGTAVTTGLSLVIAIPLAIGIAIFVTEVAPKFLKGPIGAGIELLAAIHWLRLIS